MEKVNIKVVDPSKVMLETGRYICKRSSRRLIFLITIFSLLAIVSASFNLRVLDWPVFIAPAIVAIILFIIGAYVEEGDTDSESKLMAKGKRRNRQRGYLERLSEDTNWKMEWVFKGELDKITKAYSTTMSSDEYSHLLELAEKLDHRLLEFVRSHYCLCSIPELQPPESRFFYNKIVLAARTATNSNNYMYFTLEVWEIFKKLTDTYMLKRGELNRLIKAWS